jgi:hypothetical protein
VRVEPCLQCGFSVHFFLKREIRAVIAKTI